MNHNKDTDISITEHKVPLNVPLNVTNLHILDNTHPLLCIHIYESVFNTNICCAYSSHTNDIKNNTMGTNIRKHSSILEPIPRINYKKYFDMYVKINNLKYVIDMLSFSSFPEKYINQFIENQSVKNMFNHDIDIEQNYDISRQYNIDSIISISKYDFLRQLLLSYTNDMEIIKQFLVDVTRQDVFVNNIHITCIDELIIAIGANNIKIQINAPDRQCISTVLCTLMLACQSSFYASFSHLHNKCAKMHSIISDNEYTKPNNQLNYIDPRKDYHIFSLREKGKILFSIGPDKFQCSFFAKYRITDVITNQDMYIVNSEILIDMNKEMGIIVYQTI